MTGVRPASDVCGGSFGDDPDCSCQLFPLNPACPSSNLLFQPNHLQGSEETKRPHCVSRFLTNGQTFPPQRHCRPISDTMGPLCSIHKPSRTVSPIVPSSAHRVSQRAHCLQRREHVGGVRRSSWTKVCFASSPAGLALTFPPNPLLFLRLFGSVMLYSSTGEATAANAESTDANTYRPFRTLDTTVMASIAERLDLFDGVTEEGEQGPSPA